MAQNFSQNNGSIGGLSDFVLYVGNAMRSLETGYKQLRDPTNTNVGTDLAKMGYAIFSEITRRYPNSTDGMIDFIAALAPPKYQTTVKGVVKALSKEPWDVTVGIAAELLENSREEIIKKAKEMGKDEKTGQYIPTEEVLRTAVGKFLQKEFVERYMRRS